MKGWGSKSSVCPSKPRKTKLVGGIQSAPPELPTEPLISAINQIVIHHHPVALELFKIISGFQGLGST